MPARVVRLSESRTVSPVTKSVIVLRLADAIMPVKSKVSFPPIPVSTSIPLPPLRMLLASLPLMTLAPTLPVPLIAAVPVRVRFSTLVESVVVTDAVKVSVIVVVTDAVLPKSAFVGLERVRLKVSSGSLTELLRIGIFTRIYASSVMVKIR